MRHHRRAAQRYVRFVMGDDPGSLVVGPSEAVDEAAAARDGHEAERCLQREIERLFVRLAARMSAGMAAGKGTTG